MAVMWDMLKDDKLSASDKLETVLDFDSVLGLKLGKEEQKIRR